MELGIRLLQEEFLASYYPLCFYPLTSQFMASSPSLKRGPLRLHYSRQSVIVFHAMVNGNGLFITGTDTGVGKTAITASLAMLLRSRQRPVGVMKPIQTGCRMVDGEILPDDTETLQLGSGTDDPLDLVTPYRFRSPLAPFVAGRIERKRILLSKILRAYRRLKQRHSFMLVEGIGGILVPITKKSRVLELIQLLGLPLLIVARSGLGTLNHTLLTVERARDAGIPVAAIVLNTPQPKRQGPAEKTNPEILAELTGLPVLGPIPYIEGLQPDEKGFKTVLKSLEPWRDGLLKLLLS